LFNILKGPNEPNLILMTTGENALYSLKT
jgi:hypothetical protein